MSTGFAGQRGSVPAAGRPSLAEVREEVRRLGRGQRWEDRSFSARSDSCLFRPGGRSRPTYNDGRPINWRRPHELKGVDPARVDLVVGSDGASAGDVVQGELGDCYLLGAMSAIAAAVINQRHGALLLKRIKSGKAELDQGFVTFELYSFGEWVEVTVDTMLPCNEAAEPIFAHCRDPNEQWVQFLEKAYAKLYGSYEALDGGNVTAALVDLSGGVSERIDLLDEDTILEIADGSMWKRLMRYRTKDNYLMAAALVKSNVVDKGTRETDVHRTDLGILVNHAYTLLDVREVGESHQEKVRLLKLRNPWGMQEWAGPWADNGVEWTTAVGARAKTSLGVEFADDGTFWMEFHDFQAHFNKVYVTRAIDTVDGAAPGAARAARPGEWFRYEVEGEWTEATAGGCFNFPTWRRNPQWELQTAEPTHAFFLLMQPDPKIGGATDRDGPEGGPAYDHRIGMYVMKGDARYRRKVLYDSEEIEGDDVVDSTPYIEYREVQANTMDEEGEAELDAHTPLVLCPSTFQPHKTGRFRIVVITERPLAAAPTPVAPLRELAVEGTAWRDGNAGGCRNYVSWRSNEQFLLRLNRGARATVVLMRDDPEGQSSDKALHSKKSKARSAASKKGRNKAKDNFLIGFVAVRVRGAHAERKLLRVDEDDVEERTQYTLNYEVAREFIAAEGGAFVIVPTTFEPGKLGPYTLKVFTDDQRAQLAPLPSSGPGAWHQHPPLKGRWTKGTSGGCRNYPSWVLNPMYKLRAQRGCTLEAFVRQVAERGGGGGGGRAGVGAARGADGDAEFDGIGFYVTRDDLELSLDDIVGQGGFSKAEEVAARVQLLPDTDYLLLPAPYKKGVHADFEVQLFSDAPLEVVPLGRTEADRRRRHAVESEAASTIQRWLARKAIWRELRKRTPQARARAKEMMHDWFHRPMRDNDEGYADINLALNALESAFIQLTGKAESKGTFFPQMRKRIAARGHKVADYEVCL